MQIWERWEIHLKDKQLDIRWWLQFIYFYKLQKKKEKEKH